MTTKYDPALCERLIAEAREDDARMTPGDWTVDDWGALGRILVDGSSVGISSMGSRADSAGIARTRNNLRALADQLAAARLELDVLRNQRDSYAEMHKSAEQEAEAMRPVVEAAVTWRETPVVDAPISYGGSTAPWVRAHLRLERAIDAYRAAGDKAGGPAPSNGPWVCPTCKDPECG